MKPQRSCILAVNAGSSSIKFALFEVADSLSLILEGEIDGISELEAVLRVERLDQTPSPSQSVAAHDNTAAINVLLEYLQKQVGTAALAAVGHRVVQGGPKFNSPLQISRKVIEELQELSPFDSEHLPGEISLIEALMLQFPEVPQVACFDTAFHHNLPRVAQLLPIPRRYEAKRVGRYGFHGLSYAFLMDELGRLAGADAARGRVILAYLGSGASLAAVFGGKPFDTSMGFTPAAGVPMSSRSGDLDPGLGWYLSRTEGMSPEQFNKMINSQSGLLGISETSANIRELLDREENDVPAAEAIALFCYQVKKWIGAFAAALGGVDTLVFAGSVGENAPIIRARICDGLGFLDIDLSPERNAENARLISPDNCRVSVRVIHTNEELMIARSVARLLNLAGDLAPNASAGNGI